MLNGFKILCCNSECECLFFNSFKNYYYDYKSMCYKNVHLIHMQYVVFFFKLLLRNQAILRNCHSNFK